MTAVDWDAVLAPDAPPATVLAVSTDHAHEALAQLTAAHPDTIVRTVDAQHCRTTPAFLRALAAALDFPPGSLNWNVVEEYLYDLTWYSGAEGYALVILDCERFATAASAPDLAILDSIFDGLAADARTNVRAMPPRRLICQCAPSRRDAFAGVLTRYGVMWPATASTTPWAHGTDEADE